MWCGAECEACFSRKIPFPEAAPRVGAVPLIFHTFHESARVLHSNKRGFRTALRPTGEDGLPARFCSLKKGSTTRRFWWLRERLACPACCRRALQSASRGPATRGSRALKRGAGHCAQPRLPRGARNGSLTRVRGDTAVALLFWHELCYLYEQLSYTAAAASLALAVQILISLRNSVLHISRVSRSQRRISRDDKRLVI